MRMSRFEALIASTALAVLALSPSVDAADPIRGVIKELNTLTSIVTLEDGTDLRITSRETMAKLHEGDKVEVTFEEKDGQKVVSSVEVTGP
jgi:Cu/Ag efflux protein CusF